MKEPGKLVTVNDTQMHVYKISQSPKRTQDTIVFLSGSGTECPTYDFKPLWNLLTDKYNMVIVERPGYGWSGQTDRPRDIRTLVEETREVLKQAEISGPFIPAPHSMAGLEALYWAQRYPDEISGIIGLDMAVPQVYETLKIPGLLSLQIRLGHLLRKPIAGAMVKSHPAVKSNILTKEEQAEMRRIIAKQILSKNMIDEIAYVKDNARKVAEGECPSVPVLCCLSNDKENLKRIPTWGKVHHDYFAPNNQVKFIDLPCGHYVHREKPELIAKAVIQFVGQ